jgi:hypothetical protein
LDKQAWWTLGAAAVLAVVLAAGGFAAGAQYENQRLRSSYGDTLTSLDDLDGALADLDDDPWSA